MRRHITQAQAVKKIRDPSKLPMITHSMALSEIKDFIENSYNYKINMMMKMMTMIMMMIMMEIMMVVFSDDDDDDDDYNNDNDDVDGNDDEEEIIDYESVLKIIISIKNTIKYFTYYQLL